MGNPPLEIERNKVVSFKHITEGWWRERKVFDPASSTEIYSSKTGSD